MIQMSCYLSWFYIKPQLTVSASGNKVSCYLSWFYIKPQPQPGVAEECLVVIYLDSTSNHNPTVSRKSAMELLSILILHQTTTKLLRFRPPWPLLSILILHQTTTAESLICTADCCYLSWFYIKPQQHLLTKAVCLGCYLSWFYIKPQPFRSIQSAAGRCYLSWFYIKPQLAADPVHQVPSCYLSWFYIKPQLEDW